MARIPSSDDVDGVVALGVPEGVPSLALDTEDFIEGLAHQPVRQVVAPVEGLR